MEKKIGYVPTPPNPSSKIEQAQDEAYKILHDELSPPNEVVAYFAEQWKANNQRIEELKNQLKHTQKALFVAEGMYNKLLEDTLYWVTKAREEREKNGRNDESDLDLICETGKCDADGRGMGDRGSDRKVRTKTASGKAILRPVTSPIPADIVRSGDLDTGDKAGRDTT